MSSRKRYAVVGTGGRSRMYTEGIVSKYKEHADLVGLCDVSQLRMDYWNGVYKSKYNAGPFPTYPAEQFDRMIHETKPDAVIVTTVDGFHHQYIVRAMELGCDAITEKPMTTTPEKAKAIFDAIDRTGKKLRVTHNYRYTPGSTKMKELVMSGLIGKPTAVEFNWMLDTSHGADYFRRWHREKDKSGGLLVHKASHHFDLVNWVIDSYPQRVFCMGELKFYGKKNAEARGEKYSYTRYTGVPEAAKDPFALTLDTSEHLRGLYLNPEKDSGYIRDRNVFGEPITVEDTVAISCKFRSGVIMSYALIAYSPWEGLRLCVTGTKGRVELFDRHGSHIIAGQSDEELAEAQNKVKEKSIWHYPMFGVPKQIPIPEASGGHGGGDAGILDRIFLPNPLADPFHRDASHLDGAASCLLGFSANESIRTGLPVNCDDLLKLPEKK